MELAKKKTQKVQTRESIMEAEADGKVERRGQRYMT
jgi:hypothetical protein